MSQPQKIPLTRQFQFRLTIEEWMAIEFERVTLQYSALLDVIENVHFYGINGLIQRENQKISPFYFHLVDEQNEKLLVIVFSIPIFQALDSIALETCIEYFASVVQEIFCEKKPVSEAEISAYGDIKNLPIIRLQDEEIIPFEDFTEKIELQLRMKVRMGLQIFPTSKIQEDISDESMQNLAEIRKAKSALATIQSNLREYSAKISSTYRISVKPYLFRTSLENRFEPTIIPVFILDAVSQIKENFSVLVFSAELIARVDPKHLKILMAHEIIFDLLKGKFSRGLIEREIYQILSVGQDDPNFLIAKEMTKFFPMEEISEAQKAIREIIEQLIEENYPIFNLD
ncbi:MAG: hypothetical protein KAT16_06255 [Candidatus Heimdallarchaeota archaeon]|nr:hypothetical protein [Candidatus Heimdallarchaeota archaeon]